MNIKNLTKHCFAKINAHFLSVLIIAIIALFVTYSNLGLTKEFIGDDASVGYHFPNTRFRMAFNMWNSHIFPGKSDTIGTTSLIHITSINVLSELGLSPIFIDRLYYFLFFFVSGTGMYFLSFHICSTLSAIGKKNLWSIPLVGAVFYMLNNFTMILLSFPPTNYAYSYIFLPWIFFLYLKDFHISSNLWRKLVFVTIVILLLSGNPSNTIGIAFLLLIYELFFRKKNKIFNNFKKFIPTVLLILLLSSFIYLPVLGNKSNPYGDVLSSDNRASINFSSSTTSLENLLILRGHHSQDTFVFNEFISDNGTVIANYILLIIALSLFLMVGKSKMELFLFLLFIIFLFLAKAEHAPFSWFNRLIYDYVPLFEMYRASYFKFVYYCVFVISILLSISLLKISNEFLRLNFGFVKKTFLACSFLLVLFCAKPFFWGEVARDIHKTAIPDEYHDLRAYFGNIKTDFSVLSIPQLSSGLVLNWGNGNYYGGGHPDMFILDKPVWSNGWFLPENKMSDQFNFYKNILHRSNIKYILLHKDIPEKYHFDVNMIGILNGQTNFNKLNDQIIVDKNFKVVQDNNLFKVFEIYQEGLNAHLYIPKKSIISKRATDDFLKILAHDNWQARSVVFLEKQNIGKEKLLNQFVEKKNDSFPTLEFKKINPTKYKIRIHNAKGTFPLVFSESFHDGWKSYLMKGDSGDKDKILNQVQDDSTYKILDGNEEDQANRDDLQEFIQNGWVTDLGDLKEKQIEHNKWNADKQKEELDYVEKYNIDFVSKNFQGTIQNDNLPAGHFWETWLGVKSYKDKFKSLFEFNKGVVELPEENHLMANGYANSWVVDTDKICTDNPDKCIKNPDGTYDMEVIVEFWPQRLFYVGVGISGVTLLGCLIYLVYDWRKRRKPEVAGPNDKKV